MRKSPHNTIFRTYAYYKGFKTVVAVANATSLSTSTTIVTTAMAIGWGSIFAPSAAQPTAFWALARAVARSVRTQFTARR